MLNLRGEIFSPHTKFLIECIPIEMTDIEMVKVTALQHIKVRHYHHLYPHSAAVRLYPGRTEVGWGGQCCRFPWRSLGTPFRSMACVYWLRKNHQKARDRRESYENNLWFRTNRFFLTRLFISRRYEGEWAEVQRRTQAVQAEGICNK